MGDSNSITRREHTESFARDNDQTHAFNLNPFKGYVVEVEDVHFHFDSAVLLPDYGDAPDKSRISGLAVLVATYKHAREHPDRLLLDAGHTDTSGQDAYNLSLSVKRADNVLFALEGNRGGWVGIAKAQNRVEDYQQIVKWAGWTYGWGCDPGAIDNVYGPKTKAAVECFQDNYGKTFKNKIAVDGVVGEQTWGAMFDVYMDQLKAMMNVDDAGLVVARGKLKFLGPKRVGCGENFPIEAPRKDNYRSEINRRVELLFFDPDQVPKLDCHPGAGCTPILCEVYNPKMYRYTHIPPVPIQPVDIVYDLTNVKSPDHIAPSKEKIKIEYDILNKQNGIASGKLEIIRKKDNKVLKSFPLTADQYKDGHHDDFEWDGAVTKDKEFPDGFVTIEHSDYMARVTVTGAKGDKTGTTDIKVELKDFKVELAPKDVLKNAPDKEIYDQVGSIPAGSLVKLKLKSNLFMVPGGADEKTTQAAYTTYQTLWSGGPRVPFYATATVIDSKGAGVVCGVAMGRAKVLWDHTDPAQSRTTYQATVLTPPPPTSNSKGAKPFVDKALKYDMTAGRPKDGDNCHLDRGGKRVSSSGPPIFHGADGGTQNFPFTVNKGGTRFWGCFANFEKGGKDEGRAGAIFRPSRMAGDNYSITAYLDLTFSLDKDDVKPTGALREVKVGDFEIWRLVNKAQHFKKGAQTTGAMPGITQYYQDAYIEIKDDTGGTPTNLTKATYNTEFKTAFDAIGGSFPLLHQYGLVPGDQWDAPVPPSTTLTPSSWVATFRPFAAFRAAVSAGTHKTGAALTSLLTSNKCQNPGKHAEQVKLYAKLTGHQMTKNRSTKDGITVLQFKGLSNLDSLANGLLLGRAVGNTRSRSGFLLVYTHAAQTPAHEIGHLLFLPHAPRINKADGTLINSGGGITPNFHDKDNRNCLMSYARPRPGFCGLCLLRLRGWKGDEFDQNGPKTNKP